MGNKKREKIKYVWWAFLLSLMLHLCSFVVGYIRLPGRDLVVSLSNLSAQKAHNEKKAIHKITSKKFFFVSNYTSRQIHVKKDFFKTPIKDQKLALALAILKKKLACFGKIV
ncbi:hypothetical protein JCM13304A_22280 [Desulfothermus okinawensis JCM 13304]